MNTARKIVEDDAWCRACHGRALSPAGEKDGYGLLRCGGCGTVIVNPYPDDAELAAYYNGYRMNECYLGKIDSKLRRGIGRVRRMLRENPPGRRFLDIGCSVGSVVEAARLQGLDAHGIDIDPIAIDHAQKTFPGGGHFETVAIQDMAARGGAPFDMVYMSEVIEHVRDPGDFMEAVSKIMAKDALLYLTCPDAGHFRVPKDVTRWNMVCPPNHLTLFTRDGIKRLLSRHNFKVTGFRPAFKPGLKLFARRA